jgi:hypothetical protein
MATNHIQVSISGARQDKYTKLSELADKLGCRITDLVWHSIEQVLEKPPAPGTIKSGSAPRAGKARGFWVVHALDEAGRLKGVSVQEVAQRANASGALFVRYSAGDAKSRNRSLNQAKKSALYDGALAGVKVAEATLKVTELPDKEGKAAPKTPPKTQ